MVQKKEYTSYDTERIRSIADIETVCECLGLEVRRSGRRKEILCPAHDDQHFGSCKLLDGGFHCFACGEHGDVIKLTQLVRHCTFVEACEYLCGLYSDIQGFKKQYTDVPKRRVLKDEQLVLIGLAPHRDGLYRTVSFEDDGFSEDDLERGQRLQWYPYRVDVKCPEEALSEDAVGSSLPTGYFVRQELVDRNPLQTLLDTDAASYNELICQKAIEAKSNYLRMIDMAKNPAQFFSDEDPGEFIKAHTCRKVADLCGINAWITALTEKARQCDDIRIEHDTHIKKGTSQTREKIFGRINKGGVSL